VIAFICEHKDPRVDSDLLESFPRLRCVTNATGIGPGMSHLNTLTKLVSDLSRLGESNPRPTHYEKPGAPLRARHLHR